MVVVRTVKSRFKRSTLPLAPLNGCKNKRSEKKNVFLAFGFLIFPSVAIVIPGRDGLNK